MDEDKVATNSSTVGARLKAARTKQKMSLEDIAAQTRIPLRHLESVEQSAWDRLPAPTYTIGFAKAYAGAVGMDRAEVSEQLREELGGHSYKVTSTDSFEPVDPARTMPKWLVLGAIAGVLLLVLLLSWLNERSLEADEPAAANTAAPIAAAPATPAPARPAAQGPVVLNATEQVWLRVYDKAGTEYFSGMLNPGQTFAVPSSAAAPLLKTAKPEALRINVGTAIAPTVGPAGKMISDVSLLPADLLRSGAAPAPASAAGAQAQPTAASRVPPPRPRTARRPPAQSAQPAPPPAPVPEPQPEVNGAAD